MGQIEHRDLTSSLEEDQINVVSKVAMPILIGLSITGIIVFIWIVVTLTNQFAQEVALRDAIRFHTAINTFRDYYSTQVVASLKSDNVDIEFSHDYHDKTGTLPLPATLTRELGENITARTQSSMNFYSDQPFPWREQITAEDDPFLAEALAYLRENPNDVYFKNQFDPEMGESYLRYATPSIMGESCVECHNNHPDSPVTNWQVGDVRGILEVSVPVSNFSYSDNLESGSRLILSSLLLLISSSGLLASVYYFRTLSLRAIEAKSRSLETEIGVRKMAENRLLLATEEAQNANLAKSRFLATMSHELRTPLNAIIGYSELLEEEAEEDEDEELQENLGRITRSGRHLLTIINDILDLSKIETGKLDIDHSVIELEDVFQYVNDLMQVLVTREEVIFEMVVDPRLRVLCTDDKRLRQILFNLLSNAAKFTSRGKIFLSFEKITFHGDDLIQIRVEDSGIGIPSQNLASIFDPFVQLESGIDRKYEGSGLGLAITKNLCELLGGELTVESAPGNGTSFLIILPLIEEYCEMTLAKVMG